MRVAEGESAQRGQERDTAEAVFFSVAVRSLGRERAQASELD